MSQEINSKLLDDYKKLKRNPTDDELKFLLGANLSQPVDNEGNTIIHHLAKKLDRTALTLLETNKKLSIPDLNAKNNSGYTPIHLALKTIDERFTNDHKFIQYLIDLGCRSDTPTPEGKQISPMSESDSGLSISDIKVQPKIQTSVVESKPVKMSKSVELSATSSDMGSNRGQEFSDTSSEMPVGEKSEKNILERAYDTIKDTLTDFFEDNKPPSKGGYDLGSIDNRFYGGAAHSDMFESSPIDIRIVDLNGNQINQINQSGGYGNVNSDVYSEGGNDDFIYQLHDHYRTHGGARKSSKVTNKASGKRTIKPKIKEIKSESSISEHGDYDTFDFYHKQFDDHFNDIMMDRYRRQKFDPSIMDRYNEILKMIQDIKGVDETKAKIYRSALKFYVGEQDPELKKIENDAKRVEEIIKLLESEGEEIFNKLPPLCKIEETISKQREEREKRIQERIKERESKTDDKPKSKSDAKPKKDPEEKKTKTKAKAKAKAKKGARGGDSDSSDMKTKSTRRTEDGYLMSDEVISP